MSRLDRITSDPAICHGQPNIRGLRYTVASVLELLAAGMNVEEVLADYPDLERDDVLAALEFGARAAAPRGVALPTACSCALAPSCRGGGPAFTPPPRPWAAPAQRPTGWFRCPQREVPR